jgi:hypothetical protein
VGILLGLSTARIGSGFLGVPFIVDPKIGFLAFFFSAAVGFPSRLSLHGFLYPPPTAIWSWFHPEVYTDEGYQSVVPTA